MDIRYTIRISRTGAISITPRNDNIKNQRTRVLHLSNCLLCGQIVGLRKGLKDERVMALDELGQRVHVCPPSVACPYCCHGHVQQSQRSGFFRI